MSLKDDTHVGIDRHGENDNELVFYLFWITRNDHAQYAIDRFGGLAASAGWM